MNLWHWASIWLVSAFVVWLAFEAGAHGREILARISFAYWTLRARWLDAKIATLHRVLERRRLRRNGKLRDVPALLRSR